jgi:hypothetical protein
MITPEVVFIMSVFQRLYIDGQLETTTKPKSIEVARKWLDNMERQWLASIGGQLNAAVSVERTDRDELIIVTTSGKRLRTVNVESR